MNCRKHGKLNEDDVIKKGKHKSGNIAYRCKKCMKDLHDAHYRVNKEKVLQKVKAYRKENFDKVKEWKKTYFAKYRERDRPKKQEYDRVDHKKMVETLSDRYIKHLIQKRSPLKYSDIPQSLIELKRSLLITKRKILDRKKEEK